MAAGSSLHQPLRPRLVRPTGQRASAPRRLSDLPRFTDDEIHDNIEISKESTGHDEMRNERRVDARRDDATRGVVVSHERCRRSRCGLFPRFQDQLESHMYHHVPERRDPRCGKKR